jgi:hypothetical protein
MKPHRHAEIIKAFVDGKECEYWWNHRTWETVDNLKEFDLYEKVRIKPEPKPDVVNYLEIGDNKQNSIYVPRIEYACNFNEANLKIIWDGETGKLKNAEVIK